MDQNLDIFEQVFRSVVKEYWEGREHDVCQGLSTLDTIGAEAATG